MSGQHEYLGVELVVEDSSDTILRCKSSYPSKTLVNSWWIQPIGRDQYQKSKITELIIKNLSLTQYRFWLGITLEVS